MSELDRPDAAVDDGDPAVSYHAISPLAIIAFGLGLAAPAVYLHPVLLVVPLIGVGFSLAALSKISSSGGALTGRRLAIAALALSLVFAVAVPTEWLAVRWQLAKEADVAAFTWFDYLRDHQPLQAHAMSFSPVSRPKPDRLARYYETHPETRRELEVFLDEPLSRALMALGPRATIRWYETVSLQSGFEGDTITNIYAVTYKEDERLHTFFVKLSLERTVHPTTGDVSWRVLSSGGKVRPSSLPS